MSATLLDVCRRSGVSTATVSRVVNESPLVHERTRRKVLQAIRELGYHPSHAARTLARQRSDTLGVVFPQITSGFFTEVLQGIDDVAAESGFHLMTAFAHGHADEKELVNRYLQERRVDALILMNLDLPNRFIKAAAGGGLPIVLLDRPVAGTHLSAVSMDNAGGAAAALAHLYEHGYRRVAVLAGPEGNYDAEQRLKGCRRTAVGAGRRIPEERIWRGAFTEDGGWEAVRKRAGRARHLPDAIFACNDDMAVGAMRALGEKGVRVPEDVAVVGFDDNPCARHLGLTTVRVPMREMGRAAATAALQQLARGEAGEQRVLDVELIVRRSCGCDRRN